MNTSPPWARFVEDEEVDAPPSYETAIAKRRSLIPPPQPIFLPEPVAIVSPPPVSQATSWRSKPLMQRIRKMRDTTPMLADEKSDDNVLVTVNSAFTPVDLSTTHEEHVTDYPYRSEEAVGSAEARVFPRVAGLELRPKPCGEALSIPTSKSRGVASYVGKIKEKWRPSNPRIPETKQTSSTSLTTLGSETDGGTEAGGSSVYEQPLDDEGKIRVASNDSQHDDEERLEDVPEFFRAWLEDTHQLNATATHASTDVSTHEQPPLPTHDGSVLEAPEPSEGALDHNCHSTSTTTSPTTVLPHLISDDGVFCGPLVVENPTPRAWSGPVSQELLRLSEGTVNRYLYLLIAVAVVITSFYLGRCTSPSVPFPR